MTERTVGYRFALRVYAAAMIVLPLVLLVVGSVFASIAHAADPDRLFSSQITRDVRAESSEPWEEESYTVHVRKGWRKGRFILNTPGGKGFLAESGKHSGALATIATVEIANGARVTTSKGKLYAMRRLSGNRGHRAYQRSRPGLFIISEIEGPDGYALNGVFHAPGGKEFRLESRPSGAMRLVAINGREEPSCAGDLLPQDSGPIEARAGDITIKSHSVVRVLAVYSLAAKNAAGGAVGIANSINLMIAYANQSFINSGIDAELVLTSAVELIGADENTSFNTNLNRITSLNDGYWDDVATLRTAHSADMVAMIVNTTEYCGLAWVAPGSPNYAFSVINRTCTTSLSHELGHNFGAMHDAANAGSGAPYSYGFGWRFTGNSSTQYRTVMSYAPGDRIAYFSNPSITHDGQPTGIADSADNARVLRATMPLAAAFRPDPSGTPTATPTITYTTSPGPSPTPTATLVATATAVATATMTRTPTFIPTGIATATRTSAPTSIAPGVNSPVPTGIPTKTPIPATPEPTTTPVPPAQPSLAPTAEPTQTPIQQSITATAKTAPTRVTLSIRVAFGPQGAAEQMVDLYATAIGKETKLNSAITSGNGFAKIIVRRKHRSQRVRARLAGNPSVSSPVVMIPPKGVDDKKTLNKRK